MTLIEAAKWLMLAKSAGLKVAATYLAKVKPHMTSDQIAAAEQRAEHWQASHHQP